MKRILLTCLVCLLCSLSFAQKTEINGAWTTGSSEVSGRLKSVEIYSDAVVVTIELKALKALKRMSYFSTYNTYIATGDLKLLQLSGTLVGGEIKSCGPDQGWGWNNVPLGETRSYQLVFKGKMPSGITTISIVDYGDYNNAHGYCFRNYTINNPRYNYFDIPTETVARQYIDNHNDGITGVYEPVGNGAKVACIKGEEGYYLVYLSAPADYAHRGIWQPGDIKAHLRPTASGIMKADWLDSKKGTSTMYVVFDGVSMVVTDSKADEQMYLKTYPVDAPSVSGNTTQGQRSGWTGTGFALKNGFIITNNHVVDGATSIVVKGVNGTNIEYKAEVVTVDKNNDLALIRINDYRFDGFGPIPYSVKESLCDVGEDVFVLGFPMTSAMGEEVKLTNGIISSRSGYQGDITTYQISAPIQPGNSGGPMFDRYGNVVGIVNAGIPGAENVGYAIKASYMCTLVNSTISGSIIPNNNTISSKSLPEKVKALRNYVFYIICH